MTFLLYLPGAEYSLAICVYQYANDELWVIGILTSHTVVLLHNCRIELVENIRIYKALMIFGKKIEYIAGK